MKITRGLEWPKDLDNYRDIALTQTILDGGYGKDAYYLNEHIWYNPGHHFLMAGASVILHKPVPEIIAQYGLIFNILSPIAFYILLRFVFGSPIALISTLAYLISNTVYPDWASSLYSFIPFVIILSQSFLYITINSFYSSIQKKRGLFSYFITGILLGITFLFNTTAALLCTGIIALCFLWEATEKWKSHQLTFLELNRILKKILIIGIPAFLLSLIFVYPILKYYHFKMLNKFPVNWEWPSLSLSNLPHFIGSECLQVTNWIAAFGLIHLIKNKDSHLKVIKRILLTWFTLILFLLFYSYMEKVLRSVTSFDLPSFSPVHQYFFFFKALTFIFFGYGLASLGKILLNTFEKNNHRLSMFKIFSVQSPLKLKITAFALLIIALPVIVLYVYSQDERLGLVKLSFVRQAQTDPLIHSYRWIRENTNPADVFLCSNKYGMRVVAPAGRKVIATHPFFSNPYVSYNERIIDREQMFKDLNNGNVSDTLRLFKKYGATYFITEIPIYRKIHRSCLKLFKKKFICNQIIILKVRELT
ncbi:MAG: hypothetical protein ACM3SY_20490 [Candidatus Omnitrophota bacterium]